jgi:hypothetical protein
VGLNALEIVIIGLVSPIVLVDRNSLAVEGTLSGEGNGDCVCASFCEVDIQCKQLVDAQR